MKYALGNMLNGAGGLNPDGLALDLQFAADKTLTARKGPSPILTRGSTGTFVGSNGLIQTAAVNAARFDHDPVTPFACRGLLIEEGRTNLLTRSEGLDANPWFPINTTTITSNNATAPDGATTAERFTVGGATQSYGIFNSATSWTSGVTYTTSFFCKADQVTRVRIGIGNPSIHPISAIFDLTGSGSIIGTPTGTASIERYANGWYRCAVTATSTTTGLTSLRLTAVTGTTDNYPGNSVDSFLAWGAQNEAGSFATSYIPTTTSALARSADVCSITGADFTSIYNEPEHTLFCEALSAGHANFPSYLSFDNATSNEQSALVGTPSPNRFGCYVVDGGSVMAAIQINATLNQFNKLAAGMKANSFQLAVNNSLGTEDASGSMPTANNLKIGRAWNNNPINGVIRQVKIYKKRLPNAKLASLTV